MVPEEGCSPYQELLLWSSSLGRRVLLGMLDNVRL